MSQPTDPRIASLQQRIEDWAAGNIDVVAEERVAHIRAAGGGAERVEISVTLTDGTFVCVSCRFPADATMLDLALREAVRQTSAMRGVAPAMNGVDLETLSPEEVAARFEHYLVANPLVRWQRTREHVDRHLHALHLRTAGSLASVGARWIRLEEDSPNRALHGLLCASPEGASVFYVGAIFRGRAQVEAGGGSDYRLRLVCDPDTPDALRAQLIAASQGEAPAQIEDIVPRLEAMAMAVVAHFG